MFFSATIIASIATLIIFIQKYKGKEIVPIARLVIGICFAFSWMVIVMWFSVWTEDWQLSLNTPAAYNLSLPAWGHAVINLLRRAVFLLPVSRLTLGIFYASPVLLIPIALAVINRQQIVQIMLFSSLINWLFYWNLFIIDTQFRSLEQIPLKAIILLTTYLFVLYLLAWKRPFHNSITRLR